MDSYIQPHILAECEAARKENRFANFRSFGARYMESTEQTATRLAPKPGEEILSPEYARSLAHRVKLI